MGASFDRDEVEAAFRRYWRHGAVYERWDDWALSLFTEDVVYIEHIYGTMRGRDTVQAWIDKTMSANPHIHAILDWYMIEGHRVVVRMTNRYPNPDPTGEPLDFAGVTVLEYAGDGRFSSEEDYWDLGDAKRCYAAFQAGVAEHGDAHLAETPEQMRLRDPWPESAPT